MEMSKRCESGHVSLLERQFIEHHAPGLSLCVGSVPRSLWLYRAGVPS